MFKAMLFIMSVGTQASVANHEYVYMPDMETCNQVLEITRKQSYEYWKHEGETIAFPTSTKCIELHTPVNIPIPSSLPVVPDVTNTDSTYKFD